MLREIVRALFGKLAQREDSADRHYRRRDLVDDALALAIESGIGTPSASSMTSAVDAELRRHAKGARYLVVRLERGIYRFLPSDPSADIVASGRLPISPEVVAKFTPPETPRLPLRAARNFLAGELGSMDARTLVATDLLKLKDEELDSLFALQGLAL